MVRFVKPASRLAGLLAMAVFAVALCLSPARAGEGGDDNNAPAPRTAIEIGGASVVLISANDRLYAFIDRLEDNAPVEDGTLAVTTAEGNDIAMQKASGGLFVGPLKRAGRLRDAFLVSLKSAEGTGEQQAEIVYDDVKSEPAAAAPADTRSKIWIAVVAGLIGLFAGGMAMRWLSARRHLLRAA